LFGSSDSSWVVESFDVVEDISSCLCARDVLTPVVWVPLVIRFPFPVEPAVRVATQVRNIDLAPTLLELAGVPVPVSFEGTSLVRLLTGEHEELDRRTYAALGVPLFPDASVQTTVSDGSWTYARNAIAPADAAEAYKGKAVAPGAEFLFDRRVDPGESANLMTREVAEAERLSALLDAHLSERDELVVEKGVRIDPSIAERLRAMGYLR
jgi:arylsulfatase A-like enzyme